MGRKTMMLILFHPAILSVFAVLGFGPGATIAVVASLRASPGNAEGVST
jgi:hypothetical protein